VDEALDWTLRVVADRVVRLGRVTDELARVGNELAGDRVVLILRPDEFGQRRGEADGVALRHGLKLGEPLRRGEPGFDEVGRSGEALGGQGRRRGLGEGQF